MLRYASTLAFLSVAAAWSTDIESSVQHPDAHIDGFVISAVHLHGDHEEGDGAAGESTHVHASSALNFLPPSGADICEALVRVLLLRFSFPQPQPRHQKKNSQAATP